MKKGFVIIENEDEFVRLIQKAVKHLQSKPEQRIWISAEEAMELLGIKKSRLAQLRTNGSIRFTQPSKKMILYDKRSIIQFLVDNAFETF